VLVGSVYVALQRVAPAVIEYSGGEGTIVLGELVGGPTVRTWHLAAVFQRAGIRHEVATDMLRILWEKFLFIAGVGGVTALARSGIGPLLASAEGQRLLTASCAEVDAIAQSGGHALAVPGSMTEEGDVQRAVHTTLERFGRVDILVNNAGSTSNAGPLHDMTDKTWDETMDVFLRGVFRFSRAVIPHMVQQGGGAIVNIASVWGLKAVPGPRTRLRRCQGGRRHADEDDRRS